MIVARIDGKIVEIKLEHDGLRVYILNQKDDLLYIPYDTIEDIIRYKGFMTSGIKIVTSDGDIYKFMTGRETSSTEVIKDIKNKISSQNDPLLTEEESPIDLIEPEEVIEEDIKVKCLICGTENPDNAEFCIKCGNGLGEKENIKICSHCGAENPSDAQFCQKCGKNITISTTTIVQQEKPQIETQKGLSASEAVVVCLFSPIAGAIAYLVWHDTKPKKAQEACIIAIIAFVVLFFGYFASQLIYRSYFDSSTTLNAQRDVDTVRQGLMILPLLMG